MKLHHMLPSLVTRHSSLVIALALALVSAPAGAETVQIASAADWAAFANRVNAGETDLDARLVANVVLNPDAPRVGDTKAAPWTGDFDGNGRKLTVAFKTTATGDDRNADLPAAPFAYVGGDAKVHDLHVAGTVETNGRFAAGVFGWVVEAATLGDVDVRIVNCRVSVAIKCTIAGDATSGGFVGAVQHRAMLAMIDCLFDGSLLGETADSCGGLVGYVRDTVHHAHTSCLFAPSAVTISTNGCQTLVRNGVTNYSYDECYYTEELGRIQGVDASSMTAEELVAALGGGWVVANGKAMLQQFASSEVPSDPEPAVAGFVYQGALRDAQGFALAEKRRTVEIRLYAQAAGGTSLWGRKHDVLLDDAGLFLVQLSDDAGTPVDGDPGTPLADVLARNAGVPLFAGVTVAGAGAEISPRQKLLPAPFALLASDASAARGDFAVAGALSAEGLVVSDELAVPSAQVSGAATAGTLGTAGGVRADGNLSVGGELAGFGTIPVGGIVAWNGPESGIPNGWALCNGQTANGRKTPDLRNRFVVAAGGQYKAGDTGGEDKHRLTVSEMPSHSHTYKFKGADFDLSWDDDNYVYDASEHYKDRPQNDNQKSTNSAGGDQPHENRPPYYALCYIMRVR